MSWRTLGVVVLLGMVAWASWWWREQPAEQRRPIDPEQLAKRPEYVVEAFTVTQMNEAGLPDYRLKARELNHYGTKVGNYLRDARVVFHRAQGTPWRLGADRGWVSTDATQIWLHGEVRIERSRSPYNRRLQAHTRDLLIQPEKGRGRSEAFTQLWSEGVYAEGTGVRAELHGDRITLLSQVKTRYEQPNRDRR